MKVGIIGKGTVGSAVYDGLEGQGHDMSFFDPKFEAGERPVCERHVGRSLRGTGITGGLLHPG